MERMLSLDDYISTMRPVIEDSLRKHVEELINPNYKELRSIIKYHMGWEGEGVSQDAQGKRIRPLLLLLCIEAMGGNWQDGLPAAAAVEFIHNFTLLHDDIEDLSKERRGRPTVWVKWGIPQAINTGDLLFTIGFLVLNRLQESTSTHIAFRASQILQEACVRITQGQYLDLFYETQKDLTLEAYWPMIEGKTSALLACCAELGALTSGADDSTQTAYHNFGKYLGLAFQVMDDWLGIWGDQVITGKPVGSDLLSGKKTLPILYALQRNGEFAKRWKGEPIQETEVAEISNLLRNEGAETYTIQQAAKFTGYSLEQLDVALNSECEAGQAIKELVRLLLRRKK